MPDATDPVAADLPSLHHAEIATARRYADASRAASTQRAYASDWRRFSTWCLDRGLEALPTDPARATLYRQLRPQTAEASWRRGPTGQLPDVALVEQIWAVLSASPSHGEGHRKVWARLRFAGVRTSRHRILRLMREHALLALSRVGSPRGPRNHDGTIIADMPNTMSGKDMTTTWTRTTIMPSASASTPSAMAPASKRLSRSAKGCASLSALSPWASEQLRLALLAFRETYSIIWLIQRLG